MLARPCGRLARCLAAEGSYALQHSGSIRTRGSCCDRSGCISRSSIFSILRAGVWKSLCSTQVVQMYDVTHLPSICRLITYTRNCRPILTGCSVRWCRQCADWRLCLFDAYRFAISAAKCLSPPEHPSSLCPDLFARGTCFAGEEAVNSTDSTRCICAHL